ncbi:hypothetical protein RHGRI_011243 [Rhododendron griersonianum]|uniref:Uncharacterized protein n=1 Tax=Rhododendron griersonianum TaxID=479676 RepID=A0AAV6KLW3_9ERIC|nr:hypothetical protein RHGRI_011243 [Rhododendron griersonianum]
MDSAATKTASALESSDEMAGVGGDGRPWSEGASESTSKEEHPGRGEAISVIVESSTPEKGLDNIWTSTGEEVESGSRIPDSGMVVKRMDDCKTDSND